MYSKGFVQTMSSSPLYTNNIDSINNIESMSKLSPGVLISDKPREEEKLELEKEIHCNICYTENTDGIKYFKCLKNYYHNICYDCFDRMREDMYREDQKNILKCPTCKAHILNECKYPTTLSLKELVEIDTKKIYKQNIYPHMYFKKNPECKLLTIQSNNKIMKFYSLNGKMEQFNGMFICSDGFLYRYDNNYDIYYIGVTKGKYQFWDNTRVNIQL